MQENNMPKRPSLEASEEELKLEFREIMKKRREYEDEIRRETIAFQKKEAAQKRRRMSGFVKAAVVVLVAGTCLIGFASKSEATRMWWLTSVERIIGRDTGHVVDNDENRVIYDFTEEQAAAEIEEKTGIPMPELQYRPEELVFDGFNYDEISLRGGLYYLYDEYVITMNAFLAEGDVSYSWNYDGTARKEKVVETVYGNVTLFEIKAENDEQVSVSAEWEYMNHQYQLVGKMPMEELEKIILNIFY